MADQRKADLIAQLERARSQASANSRALGEDLHVGDKLKHNIEHNRTAWLSGAVLTGLIVAKLPPRTKPIVLDPRGRKAEREVEKAGMAGLLLAGARMVFNLVRPFLMKWITGRLTRAGYLRAGGVSGRQV